MSKAQHTPGPWEAIQYNGDWTVRRVGAHKNEADVTDTFGDHVSLMEGDARLIAAAPDMAEALKNIIKSWEDSESWLGFKSPFLDAGKKALAKAGVK